MNGPMGTQEEMELIKIYGDDETVQMFTQKKSDKHIIRTENVINTINVII